MIRIFFADGSHEDRPGTCPAFGARPAKHPQTAVVAEGGFVFALAAKGGDVWSRPLTDCFRRPRWWVYRITGCVGKRLSGEWQSCRVETTDEQIARLTAERDEARRLASLCLRSINGPEVTEMRELRAKAKQEGWLQ